MKSILLIKKFGGLVEMTFGLVFSLRLYAGTGRKPNVSLEDLIRCCPFSRGHSGEFPFLEVFILRFVKSGTPTPISLPNIRSDPAP